jgi:putative lipoic acid-binding regulatory protein
MPWTQIRACKVWETSVASLRILSTYNIKEKTLLYIKDGVVMSDKKMIKLNIEYPCSWVYKIIGPDADAMRRAVVELCGETPCSVTPSHSSKTGKYRCLDVRLTVESESHRLSLYDRLKSHAAVKVIL